MNANGVGDVSRFRRELTRLRHDGAALLIVGDAVDAHRGFCHQVLQRETVSRRVFVDTDASTTYRPGQPGPRPRGTDDAYVQFGAETRSASATTTVADDDSVGTTAADDDAPATHVSTLVELGEQLSADITEAAAAVDEPAALRLCIDSLLPLVDATDDRQVFRLLHLVLDESRRASAMAHVHLPVEPSAFPVALYQPLFDAVVELRVRDGLAEQRWRLDDADVTTEWLPIKYP